MRRELLLLIVLVLGPPSVWRVYRDAGRVSARGGGDVPGVGAVNGTPTV